MGSVSGKWTFWPCCVLSVGGESGFRRWTVYQYVHGISVRPRRGIGNQRKWYRIVKKKAIWRARGLAGNMIFTVSFFFFQHSLEEAEWRGLMLQGALVALWRQGGGHECEMSVSHQGGRNNIGFHLPSVLKPPAFSSFIYLFIYIIS